MSRAVLITGAGARIGAVLAKGLSADGWKVAVHYNRSADKAGALVSDIQKAGGQAVAIQANLNVPHELNTLVKRASDGLNTPLTALINNASTFDTDNASDFDNALFDHHMDTNLRAPLRLSQQFAAQLRKGETGCIINMIDNRILRPTADYFTYTLSKAGLYWATKTLAQSFAPHVRVNGIGPGPTIQNKNQTSAEFAAEKQATLTRKGSSPDTILGAVRYLLNASAVTGQMIAVDGGQHLFENSLK